MVVLVAPAFVEGRENRASAPFPDASFAVLLLWCS